MFPFDSGFFLSRFLIQKKTFSWYHFRSKHSGFYKRNVICNVAILFHKIEWKEILFESPKKNKQKLFHDNTRIFTEKISSSSLFNLIHGMVRLWYLSHLNPIYKSNVFLIIVTVRTEYEHDNINHRNTNANIFHIKF